MAFDRRFELGLAWRTLLVVVALALLVGAFATPGLVAARAVALIVAAGALAGLWRHIHHTNAELARFVRSVRFEDYSQRFASGGGGSFGALGEALDAALKELQQRRDAQGGEARLLSAVIDDAPVALLAIGDDRRVELLNKAARRQFGRPPTTRVEDFAAYGAEFAAACALPPGGRRITRIVTDGVAQRAMLATARVERVGEGMTIASVLPMQGELGALEVAAQAELVRVLTHEIMNSLTPVTSLARSSAELVAAAAARDPALDDARTAVETVARRAEGILRFVESYRAFARSPELSRRRFAVAPWVEEIAGLARADRAAAGVTIGCAVDPPGLTVDGDPDLLAQVILNLIRNAVRAVADREAGAVAIEVGRTASGAVLLEVRDNGPGIPAERRRDVFLPFYTTHAGGSGVGLSFARQVVLAHGGSISADEAPGGGALIRIGL